jgi:hypothetical protein
MHFFTKAEKVEREIEESNSSGKLIPERNNEGIQQTVNVETELDGDILVDRPSKRVKV